MLSRQILNKEKGLIFYGLTPPKANTEEEKLYAVAAKQIERIKGIPIDGLILYDIQDESSRVDSQRPFPFIQTLDPDIYSEKYLSGSNVPKIIYKSVGKYNAPDFIKWLDQKKDSIECSVFVGAPSKFQSAGLHLNEAYKLKKEINSPILLGGVTIPERHHKKGDEHIRIFEKIDKGCSYFISQCVYSIDYAKNLLSDYYYGSQERNREMVPIIFTLTPCGSLKTLEFMKWLGIEVPNWLNNDLKHSKDILLKSIDINKKIVLELLEYSLGKDIPIGFNIESVALRKEEIEASIELLKDVKDMVK